MSKSQTHATRTSKLTAYRVEFPCSDDPSTLVVHQPAVSPYAAIFAVATHYGHLKAHSGSYSVTEVLR